MCFPPHLHPQPVSSSFQEFNKTVDEIEDVLKWAGGIMAVLVSATLCVAVCVAHAVSEGITKPVNQLIDVLRALNRLNFSYQVHASLLLCVCAYPCACECLSLCVQVYVRVCSCVSACGCLYA